MQKYNSIWLRACLALWAVLSVAGWARAEQARNVFVMISDGASFGAWDAADLYQYGRRVASPYFGPDFDKYLMTTYPLGGQYDPEQAWDLESYQDTDTGYLHRGYTCSAAAGTALSTGQKTSNARLNWQPDEEDGPIIPTLPEWAKSRGKVVGTIASVQWSHATPASFSNAHSPSRNRYAEIARQMLEGDVMDVIMGAGHPQYDNDGRRTLAEHDDPELDDTRARFVGGRASWIDLKEGTHPGGWTSIDSTDDFEGLASGPASVAEVLGANRRLVGTVPVATTLQQSRSGYAETDRPFEVDYTAELPSLATMARGALNVLSHLDAGEGIFLQIEGGAVDWAAHRNQTARLVEEQVDFNLAIQVVIDWIEAHGGWEENLLIITTDHGNGMPMGPASDTVAHARIEREDLAGGQFSETNPQGVRWWTGAHTNELVPLFVRGAGAAWFDARVDGQDPHFAHFYPDWAEQGFDGRYVDNTDVFHVAVQAMSQGVPAEEHVVRSLPCRSAGDPQGNPRLDLICLTEDPRQVPTDEQARAWLEQTVEAGTP